MHDSSSRFSLCHENRMSWIGLLFGSGLERRTCSREPRSTHCLPVIRDEHLLLYVTEALSLLLQYNLRETNSQILETASFYL